MEDSTIVTGSPVGQRMDKIKKKEISYLVFGNNKVQLASKITIGRETDNNIVVDSKLASRYHCIIQQIQNQYFVKDEGSTNGTFVNGRRIPPDKYVKLNVGDTVTVGGSNLVMA